MNASPSLNPSAGVHSCPNAREILEYASSRGITDAKLTDGGCFGWFLCSASNLQEDGESLLSRVAKEMNLTWGGGSSGRIQIKPEQYERPVFADPRRPGRPLSGYLGCPVAGERFNDKKHPWHDIESVDTLTLLTRTESENQRAITYFRQLGYLCWFEGESRAEARKVAVLVLPKFNPSATYSSSAQLDVDGLCESLESARKFGIAHFVRVARAVFGAQELPPTRNARELIRMIAKRHISSLGYVAPPGSPLAIAARL